MPVSQREPERADGACPMRDPPSPDSTGYLRRPRTPALPVARSSPSVDAPETLRAVASAWWPLAVSWMFMGLEMPAASAVIARLPDPVVSLAALGGVIYPICFVVEAPIVSLLTASNALCGDMATYRRVRGFMAWTAGILTAAHLAIAATPLYDLVVDGLIGVPPEVSERARLGLLLMLPWTAAIAYRRFQQGVLIRQGRSRVVGLGTAVRLATVLTVLATGFLLTSWPGLVVGTAAIAAGVTAEAVYAGIAVQPALQRLPALPPDGSPPLTLQGFLDFYVPLALSPMLLFLVSPLVAAALSRMPEALPSLACWPVVAGFLFLFRCWGQATNEVVVARMRHPGAGPVLLRFGLLVAATNTSLMLLALAAGGARAWYADVSGLAPDLVSLATGHSWLALAVPALSVAAHGLQGVLVARRRTRCVTESVFINLAVYVAILAAGIVAARWTGLAVGLVGLTGASAAQAAWLALRVRQGDAPA